MSPNDNIIVVVAVIVIVYHATRMMQIWSFPAVNLVQSFFSLVRSYTLSAFPAQHTLLLGFVARSFFVSATARRKRKRQEIEENVIGVCGKPATSNIYFNKWKYIRFCENESFALTKINALSYAELDSLLNEMCGAQK